jgi:hypothetical protein
MNSLTQAESLASSLVRVPSQEQIQALGARRLGARDHWLFQDGSLIHAKAEPGSTGYRLLAVPSAGAKFRVLFRDATLASQEGVWGSVNILAYHVLSPGIIYVMVAGSGADLERLVESRPDIFLLCDRDPSDFRLWHSKEYRA